MTEMTTAPLTQGEPMTMRQLIEALFPGRWDEVAHGRATDDERNASFSAICKREREAEAGPIGEPYFRPHPGYFPQRRRQSGGYDSGGDFMSHRDDLAAENEERIAKAHRAADNWARERLWGALRRDLHLALTDGRAIAMGRKAGAIELVVAIPAALWGILTLNSYDVGDAVEASGTGDRWVMVSYSLAAPVMETAAIADMPSPSVVETRQALEARCEAELRAACAASPDRPTETAAAFEARWTGLGIKREALRTIRAGVVMDFPAWSAPGRKRGN